MMFRMTFPPELKDSVAETLEDEKKRFDKGAKSKAMKPLNRVFGSVMHLPKEMKLDIFNFGYVMFDDHADIMLSTPVDSMIKPEWMLGRLKEFERADSRIKLSVIVEAQADGKV